MTRSSARRRASGAILLLMLVFMLLLSLAGNQALRNSAMDVRVAAGLALREELRQWAAAALDAAVRSPANFPLDAAVGEVLCGGDALAADCGGPVAGVAELIGAPPAGLRLWYRVERRDPSIIAGARIRASGFGGAAGVELDVARFELSATADGSALGLGQVRLVRGVGVSVGPAPPPGTVFSVYWRESMVDDL